MTTARCALESARFRIASASSSDAQVVHAREVVARDVEPARPGARREQQTLVGDPLPSSRTTLLRLGSIARDGRRGAQVDPCSSYQAGRWTNTVSRSRSPRR